MDLINTTTTRTYALPVSVKNNQLKRTICKEFGGLKIRAFFDDKENGMFSENSVYNGNSKYLNNGECIAVNDVKNSHVVHQNTEKNNHKKFKLYLEIESLEPLNEDTLKKISLFVEKEEDRITRRVEGKEKQHGEYLADKLAFYKEDKLTKPINKHLEIFKAEILETHEKLIHPKEEGLYDGMNGKYINKSVNKLKEQVSLYEKINKDNVDIGDLQEAAKSYYNTENMDNNCFGPWVFYHLENEFKKRGVSLSNEFNTDIKPIPFN